MDSFESPLNTHACLLLTDGVAHVEVEDESHLLTVPQKDGMTVYWLNSRPIGHHFKATICGQVIEKTAIRPLGPDLTSPVRLAEPAASVVICTRNRPEELARCLASFKRQTVHPREIIVVDNGSTDDRTRRAAEAAGVVYVREDRPGLDIARNSGARVAISDIIAYTDDDIVLHPRWLQQLISAFDTPEIMAVTGLVLPAELSTEAQFHFEAFWSFGQGYVRKDFDKALFTSYRHEAFPAWEVGAGASMAFRREIFQKVGLFDERLDVGQAGCSGDSEFWYRILAHGHTCRYEPSAVAFHFHRKTLDGLSSQLFHYMRGHAAALLVQNERTAIRQNLMRALWGLPKWYAKRVLRFILRGPSPSDRFLKQEVLGYVSGLMFYWRHRKSTNV
jgi:GT2 family glycosyltransferase